MKVYVSWNSYKILHAMLDFILLHHEHHLSWITRCTQMQMVREFTKISKMDEFFLHLYIFVLHLHKILNSQTTFIKMTKRYVFLWYKQRIVQFTVKHNIRFCSNTSSTVVFLKV